ncbi:MAG: helix-turn-helix transcriptional regulator [Siphonobacter sp.]
MKVYEKIRQIRLEKGYSQEVMAEELGISATAYGDVERGKTELTVSRLEQILQILHLTYESFFATQATETVRLENENLRLEMARLQQENQYLKEKFDERLMLELYRIGAATQRERIGFK